MSNPEQSAEHLDGTESHHSGDDGQTELKAMLDTIANQMLDADRRHMAALSDMQNRISGMEREADAMRPRIPDRFAPAFEQIEVAIGQLANRLADSGSDQLSARKTASHVHPADGFDMVEPGLADGTDPWDQDSADVLAGFHETGDGAAAARKMHVRETAADAGGAPRIDEAWLESRFAEIARGIEYSLAHVKPDSAMVEFGERFDQFERQFGKLFAGVATHDDFSAVRQIESHMETLVGHLEKTQDNLERLSTIEAQLADVSRTLAGMQANFSNAKISPEIDAIARAVAEETAQRFATARPGSPNSVNDELRPLIEQLMAEHRHGGDQTMAVLDTMQQAMVRLLDRTEASNIPQPPKIPAFEADHTPVATKGVGTFDAPFHEENFSRDDAAITFEEAGPGAYVPGAAPVEAPFASDVTWEDVASGGEKLREEMVADVRRAKLRLSAEDYDMPSPVSPPVSVRPTQPRSALPPSGSRPIRPSASSAKNASGPSAPSPRLMIVAALVLMALAGLWYTFGFGNRADPVAMHDAPLGQTSQSETPASAAPSSQSSQPSSGNDGANAPAPNVNGPRGDLAPAGDGNQASASSESAPQPRTALPMLGVAVDLDQPASRAELEQARRHQAMATMSGELGDAASRPGSSVSVPTSMVPTEAETEVGPSQNQGAGPTGEGARSSSLDMPAATVGPLSLRLAAAKGDASAQFEVGSRFAEAEGVKQDFKEAAKWYQLAADQGFAQAQYRIGTLYERGLGLKTDRAQAAAWYQRAAEQGNIKAMHNLAVLSAADRTPDYATAAHWFQEAAERGLPDSQFNLAVLYENGLGVERDLKQAFMWLSIAARNGDGDASHRRDILRGKLTAQEIADTQKIIASWKLVPTDRTVNDAIVAGELWKKNPKNGVSG